MGVAQPDGVPLPPVRTAPKPAVRKSSGGSTSGTYSSGSGGSSADSGLAYAKSQAAKATATQNAADRAGLDNIRSQAALIQAQIKAVMKELGPAGFTRALNIHLGNALREYQQSDATLMAGYKTKVGILGQQTRDNEAALGDSTIANTMNRIRERSGASAQAALQGAGESDTLRSQQMSLRNWDANQLDVSRSYADSRSSLNSTLGDLNVDTKTARINMAQGLQQQRGALYDKMFSDRADTWTQLSNMYGQQASLYATGAGIQKNPESGSYDPKNPMIRSREQAEKSSAWAMEGAAANTGRAWKDPGISAAVKNWKGQAEFAALKTNAAVHANSTGTRVAVPTGATLRKWAG